MMGQENHLFENFEATREKLGAMQDMQAQLVSKILNQSAELQQKQYTLLASIMRNQMEFGNSLFSGTLNIINDNLQHAGKKAAGNE